MDLNVVIPTYWGRPQDQSRQPGDAIFDHPTPLDGESTLPRLLASLAEQDLGEAFRVLILVAPVASELTEAANQRVLEIITPFKEPLQIGKFSPTELVHFQPLAKQVGFGPGTLTLYNYAGVRNMQLLASHALGCTTIVALDDDEVVPPDYMRNARDTFDHLEISGAAGFYEDKDGSIYLPESPQSHNIFLDKAAVINAAARQLLDASGRWVPTPVAFGGNMLFRQELFCQIGFDPGITRGEDLDYVINARLAGYLFWLDKSLRITHLPPHHYDTPPYAKLAEDIRRFFYEREKLRLAPKYRFNSIPENDLMPYPGKFLRDDLEEQGVLALKRLAKSGDIGEWGEPEEIVANASTRAQELAPLYFSFAKLWPFLMKVVGEDKELRTIMNTIFLD